MNRPGLGLRTIISTTLPQACQNTKLKPKPLLSIKLMVSSSIIAEDRIRHFNKISLPSGVSKLNAPGIVNSNENATINPDSITGIYCIDNNPNIQIAIAQLAV